MLIALVFATTDATNSTWGLVYAELELMHIIGELNDSQYQAALHNIQVMQDLAENAVANIGKATNAVAKNLEETRKQLENTKRGLLFLGFAVPLVDDLVSCHVVRLLLI